MPINYGIDAYSQWNTKPLGGGSGYLSSPPYYNIPVTNLSELKIGISTPGAIVYVKNDIPIPIAETPLQIQPGVKLCSYRGYGTYVGACLYTTDKDVAPLFQVMGSGVKISGLRFGGYDLAHPDFSAPGTSCAIKSNYEVEIENCEFYGWGRAAIWIYGGTGINIHHCYIHHSLNQSTVYEIKYTYICKKKRSNNQVSINL